MNISAYTKKYFDEVIEVAQTIDMAQVDKMVDLLATVRAKGGRLFIIGVGGGAGNATHAVNDFRKICDIESYTPTDNVSEMTARINDEGWEMVFVRYLETSKLGVNDAVFVMSVGGGNLQMNISANIVAALKFAKSVSASIMGIVGRDGGYTLQVADACVVIPQVSDDTVTPHTEAFQAVVWHLLVSHPKLKSNEMKWEEVK